MTPIITLLTDFGTADGYVAELKGVLLSTAPSAQLIDIAHDVERHDTNGARLALARYWRRFPAGTIHLAVVDPGVGSARNALAVQSDGYFLVGPDTGVLSPALLIASARAVHLPTPAGASSTFHGRDVFAPAAANIARGISIDSLGEPVSDPVILRTPEPHRLQDGGIEGEIIHIDRFGNAVTNIITLHGGECRVNGRNIPIRTTYSSVNAGELVALTGSNGLLEIAVREGSAGEELGLRRGNRVVVV